MGLFAAGCSISTMGPKECFLIELEVEEEDMNRDDKFLTLEH